MGLPAPPWSPTSRLAGDGVEAGGVLVAGEGVADENGIGARRIGLAIGLVADLRSGSTRPASSFSGRVAPRNARQGMGRSASRRASYRRRGCGGNMVLNRSDPCRHQATTARSVKRRRAKLCRLNRRGVSGRPGERIDLLAAEGVQVFRALAHAGRVAGAHGSVGGLRVTMLALPSMLVAVSRPGWSPRPRWAGGAFRGAGGVRLPSVCPSPARWRGGEGPWAGRGRGRWRVVRMRRAP